MMQMVKTDDNLNRLLKIVSTTDARPVSSHAYQINSANQRTKRTDGSYWDYGYDSLGHIATRAARRATGSSGRIAACEHQHACRLAPACYNAGQHDIHQTTGRGATVHRVAGPELDSVGTELLDEVRPGGVVLFARNVESDRQLKRLMAALHRRGIQIAIDQEGGRVNRLREIIGECPRDGRLIGQRLRELGVDINFAPVARASRRRLFPWSLSG